MSRLLPPLLIVVVIPIAVVIVLYLVPTLLAFVVGNMTGCPCQ